MDLIDRNWADILRVAATMAAGTMRPSQIDPARARRKPVEWVGRSRFSPFATQTIPAAYPGPAFETALTCSNGHGPWEACCRTSARRRRRQASPP